MNEVSTLAILERIHAASISLLIDSRNGYVKGNFVRGYNCRLDKDSDGATVNVYHWAQSVEDAVQGAWAKFSRVAQNGLPQLMAPVVEGSAE